MFFCNHKSSCLSATHICSSVGYARKYTCKCKYSFRWGWHRRYSSKRVKRKGSSPVPDHLAFETQTSVHRLHTVPYPLHCEFVIRTEHMSPTSRTLLRLRRSYEYITPLNGSRRNPSRRIHWRSATCLKSNISRSMTDYIDFVWAKKTAFSSYL